MKMRTFKSGVPMVFTATLGVLAYVASFSTAMATELEIDAAHSNVGFEIKHLMVSTVRGNFTDFTGKISLNEKNVLQSKIDFTVKAASINTSNAKRDEHLRSPDFFDTEKFPTATFVTKSIKKAGKKKSGADLYVLEGDLTMHGVTKLTQFDLISLGKVKDPYGNEKYIFQAETKLKRKDFGLVYNAALESGGVVIGEEVKLVIDAEAAAPKAPEKT